MKKILLFIVLAGLFQTDAISQLTGDTATGVRLNYFTANNQNNNVRLNWKVECRISFAKFEVQRSTDGINFSTINNFEADFVRCQQPFDFNEQTVAGQSFYRIKVGDLDDRFSTEKIVRVTGKEITATEIKIVSPVTGSFLQLTIASKTSENIRLHVFDMAGNVLNTTTVSPGKGSSQLEIPFATLQAGTYILSYQTATERKTVQFVKNN